MNQSGQPAPSAPSPTPRRTVSRGVGVFISTVTALAVAGVGNFVVWPERAPLPPGGETATTPGTEAAAAGATGHDARAAAAAGPGSGGGSAGTAAADGGAAIGAGTGADTAPVADHDAGSAAVTVAAEETADAGAGPPGRPPRRPRERGGARPDRASAPAGATAAAATDAGAAAGPGSAGAGGAAGTSSAGSADGATPREHHAAAVPGGAESPPGPDAAEAPAGPASGKSDGTECASGPDKDMAKEAWRRNKPTLCTLAGGAKASLIIPIKGSLENASYELKGRPNREVRVNLPEGSSLLTLKLYKLRRLGFRDLRVYRSDNAAHLRAKLAPGAGDPVVEIRTGYIKITVPVKG